MRALDLVDKLAHENPRSIEPHKDMLIGPLADRTLLAFVRRRLRHFDRWGSKALAARARRIRERLASA